MDTPLRVLSEGFPMKTNWQGLDGNQKENSLHPCALGKSSLSLERAKFIIL